MVLYTYTALFKQCQGVAQRFLVNHSWSPFFSYLSVCGFLLWN